MNESPAQRALAASSAALVVALACLLTFMPSVFERVLATALGVVVIGAVLATAVILHWAFLGIGVHRLGRSLPGWLALAVLLFPIGGVAALILLGWLSDEDHASGQPLPVR